jgi:hypothetical protein
MFFQFQGGSKEKPRRGLKRFCVIGYQKGMLCLSLAYQFGFHQELLQG